MISMFYLCMFSVSRKQFKRKFTADAGRQTGDTNSSSAPTLTSTFQGSIKVKCGTYVGSQAVVH